eukprot:gene4253-902_t
MIKADHSQHLRCMRNTPILLRPHKTQHQIRDIGRTIMEDERNYSRCDERMFKQIQ